MNDTIFKILVAIIIILMIGFIYFWVRSADFVKRQNDYKICLDDEMGEHGGIYHGPNLMERYSFATQKCNAQYREVYGIEVWEDSP